MTCDPLAYTGAGQLDLLLIIAIACLFAGAVLLLITRKRGRVATVALLLLVCGAAVSITGGSPTEASASDCPPAANSVSAADPQSAADPLPAGDPLSVADPLSDADPSSGEDPQSGEDPSVPDPQSGEDPSVPDPQSGEDPSVPDPQSGEDPGANFLTVAQTSVMEGLAPGIAPVPITGIVTNNGIDSTVIIAVDVEITGVVTQRGAVPGVCDASDYVLLETRMLVGRTLDPGGSTAFTGASIGFNDKSTNQDACKGATILLLYTANPT